MQAKPELRDAIAKQGRRNDWLADMIGVSKAQFSHIVAGRRAIGIHEASRLAAILGLPIFFLFDLPDGNKSVTEGKEVTAA